MAGITVLATVPAHARWMSICTGAFVLAAAGRPSGRRVTTHWAHAEDLRRLHPDVEVDESVLFVDDGDLATSAGLAAGLDLCLHVVRGDHGAAVANEVARHVARRVARARSLLEDSDLPVDRIAAASGLGTAASLRAHLAADVGLSPLAYRRRFRGQPASSASTNAGAGTSRSTTVGFGARLINSRMTSGRE